MYQITRKKISFVGTTYWGSQDLPLVEPVSKHIQGLLGLMIFFFGTVQHGREELDVHSSSNIMKIVLHTPTQCRTSCVEPQFPALVHLTITAS